MILPITAIKARDIPDAWFQCINQVLGIGFRYEVQQGSYIGQTRLEFDWITVKITHPYLEPWNMMLPDIPPSFNIPNPVDVEYIEQYLPYLLTDHINPGEQYTYGSRIYDQIQTITRMLQETPNTNQAILQVAQPSDIELSDPPCLRHIDIRLKDGMVVFYPYFRSWDLWSGFPANLAAIAILQHIVAGAIGCGIGPIVAASKGLHIYGYVEELAKLRCNKANSTTYNNQNY